MGWRKKMDEWGTGDFTFLSTDGECIIFVVVDEPVLLTGKYKGKEQERIGCPIVTDEGFKLFVTGKRVARKLSKFEDRFKDTAFIITREGIEGDINAKYPIAVLDSPEKTEQLFAIAKKEYKPALLTQALKDVQEVMSG